MSITTSYTHKVEPDFEQYAFPSTVNPQQCHFIDRDEDQSWKAGVVQLEESLSLAELQRLLVELQELASFMVTLEQRGTLVGNRAMEVSEVPA